MQRPQAVALIAVALVLGFVIGFKAGKGSASAVPAGAVCPTSADGTSVTPPAAALPPTPAAAATPAKDAPKAGLPRLVDLGSTTCIPCKEMAPILEGLKTEFKGRVAVEFIDVTKNAAAADEYKINVIPTQVFFDKDGKEVFRHEGFLPKADILAEFVKMGVKTN